MDVRIVAFFSCQHSQRGLYGAIISVTPTASWIAITLSLGNNTTNEDDGNEDKNDS